MRIEFNRTGAERKALVKAISEITGAEAAYLGVPSCSYQVDYFTIDRNGAVEFDDRADSEEIEKLLEALAERGIVAGEAEIARSWLDERNRELTKETPNEPQTANEGLTIAIPLDKVNAGNLTCILEAKGELIKKALGVEDIRISIDEEKISFPWFGNNLDADTISAYTKFIAAICEMSVNQKRITAKPKENENEKYAFRCFLLRLGFIGNEFKADRKILLKNLGGSSAFKSGAKKEDADNEISE